MNSSLNQKDFANAFWTGLKNTLPEIAIALLTITISINDLKLSSLCLLFIANAILFRAVWNIAILIHGLGHSFITAIVDRDPNFINLANILEHRQLDEIIRSLLPGNPILNDRKLPWLEVGNSYPSSVRIKALGGISFNLIAIAIAYYYLEIAPLSLLIFIAVNLYVVFSSRSDIVAFINGFADCFNCGNFGLIGIRNNGDGKELLPARFVDIYHNMGRETEVRGEQAGGGLVFARDKEDRIVLVGKKVVNNKRENLTKSLESAFAPVRRKAISEGVKPLSSIVKGVWHYRYGTSSTPSILETHWHEWMSARDADVWQVEDGKWVCKKQNIHHRITHNGDFEAWTIFGQPVENVKLGLWLERILHTPNATQGDSPKIAGMMDLLIAKGMWDASVRLAYQFAVADSVEEAFGDEKTTKEAPNTAPSQELLASWTAIFEEVFEFYAIVLADADAIVFQHSRHRFEEDLLRQLQKNSTIGQWSQKKQIAFAKLAVHAFFNNDPFNATKIFMSKAEGSFGLVVASTLDEERLVLSSKGQPISIGMNQPQQYTIYASEPAAVNAVLSGLPQSWRLDLDQKKGEIALVSPKEIIVYSMSAGCEWLESELAARQIPMADNPYIQPPAIETRDPVERDIKEIPQILREIELSWRDRFSFNCQSADYLVDLLTIKAERWQEKRKKMLQAGIETVMRQSTTVDLLITGVESSLWIGERFARDLKTLFPQIAIATISSNELLRQLEHDFSSLNLGVRSIVLAISQSGQTFSTLQATNVFEQLRQRGIIGELFIVTEELNSLMGAAIGQNYNNGAAFCRRIFTTGSGRRTAEPCTLSTAALQQTLTELLLYLAKRMRQRSRHFSPLGMILTPENILALEMMKDEFLYQSVVSITGTNARGQAIASDEYQTLMNLGRNWAQHVTETPLVWGIHALYVLITVGWAIPFGYTIPLAKTIFAPILAATGLTFLAPVITLIDIAIYVFGPWFWTIALRYFQGRQLFARMGKRTLVVGDLPWVHKLLKSYASKLFSLSYGIASLEVHGDNPQDQMLHHYGHRIVRGTLILLGVPDGRRGQMQKQEESATIMTGKQANGISNFRTGPEVVAIGHNPNLQRQGFHRAIVLWSELDSPSQAGNTPIEEREIIEKLRESRFNSFERLLSGYVLFWALAKKVASFPFLKYQYWKSQSRTKIMTTASPVPGVNLERLESEKNREKKMPKVNTISRFY